MDERRSPGLRRGRRIFGWLFLVSLIVFVGSLVFLTLGPTTSDKTVRSAPPLDRPVPAGAEIDASVVVMGVSLVSSVTSFLGFVMTTLFSWRREKREARVAALAMERQELELEKLRRELGEANRHRGDRDQR